MCAELVNMVQHADITCSEIIDTATQFNDNKTCNKCGWHIDYETFTETRSLSVTNYYHKWCYND